MSEDTPLSSSPEQSAGDRGPSRPQDPLTRTPGSLSDRTGEGQDKKIEKPLLSKRHLLIGIAAVLLIGTLGTLLWNVSTGGQRVTVDADTLPIRTVELGPFQEFVSVTGTAVPERTIFLDAVEGGRVEEVFFEEGAAVWAGDPLLRLSNSDLQLRLMTTEAQLSEQLANLQSMRFQVEQNRLSLRQQLGTMDFDIQRLDNDYRRRSQLYEAGHISAEEYERTRNELTFQQRQRELTLRAFQQDSLSQEAQLSQMETAVQRMQQNFATLQESLEQLTVRAPIDGRLTSFDAQVGAMYSQGTRFGQVDTEDGHVVRAQIDEFYIERVHVEQPAVTWPIGGQEYALTVSRVYPGVTDGRFQIDLAFEGEQPEGLRRGQTIRTRLQLGSREEAVMIARGDFFQHTGGHWIYVLTPDESEAIRRPIRLGRQNPESFEVLDGLSPGEQIITAGYDRFGDADRLILR